MTDNEIIKALECCLKGCNAEGCEDCPLYEKVEDCEIEIPIIALDLINRQKAEIERLKAENEGYKHLDAILHTAIDKLTANIKSEAIREFASRLRGKAILVRTSEYSDAYYAVKTDSISSVLKGTMEEIK